jgi:periplasmic divalent cation tolerance protein
MPGEVVIFVTCPASESERIATQLVEDKLVACVNIVPGVTSVYRWQGEICRDQESILIIKSNKNLWDKLEPRIRELHTYDVPEIICIPIELGHKPYLDWLNCQLGDAAVKTGREV